MTQAENNTTTAAEQPIQQSTPSINEKLAPVDALSALERARLNDTRQPVILDIEEIYQEFKQFGDTAREYRDGSAVSGEYWMYRFRGNIVTVQPDFKEAFDKGTITRVIATPTVGERTVPDPNNAGMTMQQIVYGYSITHSGIEEMQRAINARKLMAEVKRMAEVANAKEDMKTQMLIAQLTPEKIKATIKQEDIDALLAAI